MYVLGIALAVTVVDQLTKYAIHQAMVLHESIPVIPDTSSPFLSPMM